MTIWEVRHTKKMMAKALTHSVIAQDANWYVVESGESGERYIVFVNGEKTDCTCTWSKWNAPPIMCSHVIHVINGLVQGEYKSTVREGTPAEVAHLHRKTSEIQGVTVTQRLQ